MSFAARLGDLTAHGSPLSPGLGSPNVLIGGMPAWRVGDIHVCPLTEGGKPHVSGSVIIGSTTVLINGKPAARQGDKIMEVGSTAPNAIISGCPFVLIG